MSKNLAEGKGFVYNVGERVTASTCPLLDLIFGVIYYFTGNMYMMSIIVCTIFSLIAVSIVLYKFCSQKWQGILFTILLIASSCFMSYTTSGLENSLLFMLEAVYLSLALTDDLYTFKRLLAISFVCSMALLARLDVALLLFLPTIYIFFWKRRCSFWVMFLAGFLGLLPFIGWEIFSIIYYGYPFPNTFYIKVATGIPTREYVIRGVQYFFISAGYDAALIFTIVLAVVFSFRKQQKDIRVKTVSLGIIIKLLYLIRIGGDFMIGRHFTDIFFVAAIIILYMINHISLDEMKVEDASIKSSCTIIVGSSIAFSLLFRPVITQFMFGGSTAARSQICDERANYFSFTGLIPSLYKYFHTNGEINQIEKQNNWGTGEVDISIARGYKGEMLNWAPGMLVYLYNDKLYMADSVGLGDPLLSHLSSEYIDPMAFRVGHMRRTIPLGYKESLETGTNMIEDPSLHDFYDIILEITRGEIWSKDRLAKIINMNLGKYDYLVENYEKNLNYQLSAKTVYTTGLDYNLEDVHYGLGSLLDGAVVSRNINFDRDTEITKLRFIPATWAASFENNEKLIFSLIDEAGNEITLDTIRADGFIDASVNQYWFAGRTIPAGNYELVIKAENLSHALSLVTEDHDSDGTFEPLIEICGYQ